MDHPLPWLRYVDADDLDDDAIDFDGLNVESPVGEHLGGIDGFIVDADTARPYYVVVDAGGWFKSKHFLLPVGRARLDADREVLVTDVPKERVEKFPGFDKDNFEKLDASGLKRFNDETCSACSIEGVSVVYSASEPYSAAWDRSDYRYPDWWRANPELPERMGESAVTSGASYRTPLTGDSIQRGSADYKGEQIVASGSADAGSFLPPSSPGAVVGASSVAASSVGTSSTPPAPRAGTVAGTPEAKVGEADPSPYLEGRAQPGDVLGLETGGEQTHIGDTADDENERRRDAEKDSSDLKD